MNLLASCTVEQCNSFNGNLSIPNEDKGKPDKVLLNVVVDSGDTSVLKTLKGREKCITFHTPDLGKVEGYSGDVFQEVTLEELDRVTEQEGVKILVRLPEGYCDMRTLWNISQERPEVRFIGGNLLKIDGVNIGRYGDCKQVICRDMYDSFVEVDLNDLDGLQEIVRKTRKKAESSGEEGSKRKRSSSGKPKEKRIPKRLAAFNKLFGDLEAEEF